MVPRLRHSARARSAFLRSAPHLVRPLPIVVPTYGAGMKSKPVLRVGMAAYDLLTADRNRGIADPSRQIPRGRFMSREEVGRRYPGLAPHGLTGAGIFCDGQMYNPPRLVLAYAQRRRRGCRLHELCRGNRADRACRPGAGVSRRATWWAGRGSRSAGDLVLNAAGPYAEWILAGSLGRGLTPPTPFSRDAYFIVRRPLIEGDHALTVPAITTDRDAIVSRGGRHLFLVPWRGVTLVGVWHKVYQGHPDDYEIAEEELAAWIAEINGAYRGLDLTLPDVALGSAGLVPYGESDPDAAELKFAHRSRIVDHRAERGLDGLLTLIGVRYTTGPVEASEAVDLVSQRPGSPRAGIARRMAAGPRRRLRQLRGVGCRVVADGTRERIAPQLAGAGAQLRHLRINRAVVGGKPPRLGADIARQRGFGRRDRACRPQ